MRRLVLLVLTLVLSLLSGGPASAGAVEPRPWRGLDVPYVSGGHLHFRGQSLRVGHDGLVSVGATRGSAIVQPEEPELWELPARGGRARLLARDVVGLPMADPVGDWVFWTAERGRRVRLMGYDTARHVERRGPLLSRVARVWVVEGDTAYAGNLDRRVRQWRPGGRSVVVPPATIGGGIPSDVDRGRTVVTVDDGDTSRIEIRGADGAVVAALPDDLAETFDPSGRYLATWRGVWDSATGATTALDLGRWTAVSRVWAPSGELVVTAQDDHPDRYEQNPARRFVCAPATGTCDRLPDLRGPGRYRIGQEPWLPSALLQLAILIGS